MNYNFRKYLRKFLERYCVCLKIIDFNSVNDAESMFNQLENPEIVLPDNLRNQLNFNLGIIYSFRENGILLYDYSNYKGTENYALEKDKWMICEYGVISLENYIERFLHDEDELKAVYKSKSKYTMGNPHPLTEDDCKKRALAREILRIIKGDRRSQSKKLEDSIRNLIRHIYYKEGGTLDRLKTHLKFDMQEFDENKYSAEMCKIIYFIFEMENEVIPKLLDDGRTYFDMLEFLSKSTMESVDNSILGSAGAKWETLGGKITRLIKNTLEKEMYLKEKLLQDIDSIRDAFNHVSTEWDRLLYCVHEAMDRPVNRDRSLNVKKLRRGLKLAASKPRESLEANTDQASPITTLYWKVLQREIIGETKNFKDVNNMETGANYNVPESFIWRMIKLHSEVIPREELEDHIYGHAEDLIEYVYLEEEKNEEEKDKKRRKIENSRDDVAALLDCFISRRPLYNTDGKITTLLIISCLQAILTDKGPKTFHYNCYASGKSRNTTQVRGQLRKNNKTVDSLKIFWERKVSDHWYANVGRHDMRCNLREFENMYNEFLINLYSCESPTEMLSLQQAYYEYLIEVFPDFEK